MHRDPVIVPQVQNALIAQWLLHLALTVVMMGPGDVWRPRGKPYPRPSGGGIQSCRLDVVIISCVCMFPMIATINPISFVMKRGSATLHPLRVLSAFLEFVIATRWKIHEMLKWLSTRLDYQSNISKRLIIKGLDNQTQVYKYVCLIIKSLDTQVQKLHNQINQYPKKAWYHSLMSGHAGNWPLSCSLGFRV